MMSQFDPQSPSGSQSQGGQEPSDQELTDYLTQHEGHTEQSAKQEIKNDREGVKRKHKAHKDKHGASGTASHNK